MKRVLKVTEGEPVPNNATFLRSEKECTGEKFSHVEYPWFGLGGSVFCSVPVYTTYFYYEVSDEA